MKVLVIGGTRFLGKSIVRGLIKRGHGVTVIHRGQTHFEAKGIKETLLDKNDRKEFREYLSGQRFDAVIDTILSAEDLRFIIPLLNEKIGHYVHCGSTGVYTPMRFIPAREGDPCDPPYELGGYGTKLEQDSVLMEAHRESGFPATVLRPTNIYGPGDIPLDIWGGRNPGFFRRLIRGDEIIVPNDGKSLLQPGYVEELGDAFSLPLDNESSTGEIYNISSERCVTLDGYLSIIMDILASSSEVTHMPIDDLIASYPEEFKSWPAGLRFICEHMCVDVRKAGDHLGFTPKISLKEGLSRNLQWMKEQGMIEY